MSSPASTSPVPSVLRPRDRALGGPLGLSILLHVGAVVAGFLARGVLSGILLVLTALFPWCAPDPEPLITDALEVAVVSLPKSETKMPDRAARAPRPKPRPEATPPAPKPEPTPVRESELVHRTEKPEPKAGQATPDPTPNPDDLVAEIERQRLVDEFLSDAPEGPRDRRPTDPDGTSDEVVGSLDGVVGSPELAEWQSKVKGLFNGKFNPVGGRDDLEVGARVTIDPNTGKVLDYKIIKPSGVLAWDAAAERALALVQTVPLPPAKFRLDATSQYVDVVFAKK